MLQHDIGNILIDAVLYALYTVLILNDNRQETQYKAWPILERLVMNQMEPHEHNCIINYMLLLRSCGW